MCVWGVYSLVARRDFRNAKKQALHYRNELARKGSRELGYQVLKLNKRYVQEPLGKVEQEQKDAGPTTGHRRMPERVDSQGRQRPRLPSHPDTSKTDLLRERDSRHM